jgi:hypothetical protein
MENDPIEVACAGYLAYVSKDCAAIETLIADDFHFTGPLDNRLDRATYFEGCWPNSRMVEGFDVIHTVLDGERVFVTYGLPRTTSQQRETRRDQHGGTVVVRSVTERGLR